MDEQLQERCRLLLENRDRMKKAFTWESGLMHLACAGIYTSEGKLAEPEQAMACKALLKQSVGIFSQFRGMLQAPVAAMMDVSGEPKALLERSVAVYQLLKEGFWGSEYLLLAAMMIARAADAAQYEAIADRTHYLYKQIKAVHPFLTSDEDSSFCALMALSAKSDNQLLEEAEQCYQLLKQSPFSSNGAQSLGHALALCDGAVKERCEKTIELYERLKAGGYKYGVHGELPSLGIAAMMGGEVCHIAQDIMDADDWLSRQKGFGFFGSVDRKTRLMYASMAAQNCYAASSATQTALTNSVITSLLAQQTVLYASVVAAVTASNAANNN